MTVAELIEELKKMPQNVRVCIDTVDDDGFKETEEVSEVAHWLAGKSFKEMVFIA